ncbi:hypothetical protein [Mycobacterium bohemicum]|uniref:Proline rich protein n=1 Tax=Mycobacterium bohemicum TaxID=56425 RepID=A0A1X1R130_MYCBE|nr:hypothetical protein [Mycobacterium bohemicum]MCV6970192.1 hypothetical protein [Mycobacterium bohemicum]ORU97658.1 hypothetical protein AWB93_16910 [Mycobacterium bohemicum]
MKFTVSVLEKRSQSRQRPWSHLFGGRVRTSTVVLIIAFCAVWWLYDTYRPEPAPKPPANQVVPPGFVPDPNYTWVPRSRVQQPPPTVTVTPIPTTTTPTPTPTSTVPPPTTTTPPPFAPPQLPCLLPPPFCPPSPAPATGPPSSPQPGALPTPASAPPAS